MFKLTADYGQTWAGSHAAFDFYYTPDEVFEDIFSTWPSAIGKLLPAQPVLIQATYDL